MQPSRLKRYKIMIQHY